LIKRRFLKHFAFYAIFAFMNKGMSFLLTPLFTRYLTPEDYGVYALFLTATLIYDTLLSFCVGDAICYVYFKPSEYSIREYVSTFLFFCSGMFVVHIIGLAGLILFPFEALRIPAWLLLAPLTALSGIMMSVVSLMWQLREEPISYGRFNFCYVVLQLLLQTMAVAFFKLGWQGVLGAQGILALITITMALSLLNKNGWWGFCFNKGCLRFGLKFGLSFIPNTLAYRLYDSVGRFLVTQKFSLTETGIYSAGQRLGAIMNVYNQSFLNTYRPWLLKKLTGDVRQERRKIIISTILAFISMILFAGGSSFCMYISRNLILGKNFERSAVFIFWSTLAYALNGMYNVIVLFIYQNGKFWTLSLLTTIAVGLNIFLTWYFLKIFGLAGAAYAPVLAWAATLALSIVVAIRLMQKR
jgi:O-antigen/teichoic acid export membrane protein